MSKWLACVLLFIWNLAVAETNAGPQAINNLDIDRYMGHWYEVAHLPTSFAEKCLVPINVDYSHQGQKIIITSSCVSKDNTPVSEQSIAYLNEANFSGDGRLTVSNSPRWLQWLPFTTNQLWVLYSDYMYAVLATPNLKNLWIYSRQENPPSSDIQTLVKLAESQGYPTTQLIYDYPAATGKN